MVSVGFGSHANGHSSDDWGAADTGYNVDNNGIDSLGQSKDKDNGMHAEQDGEDNDGDDDFDEHFEILDVDFMD